ncbi:MAG TPA: element excision factor XisH family protein [Pyrinomonadaceae bacterium]|jgi:hypothetical protein
MADLGAERIFAAEREGSKIVVEVKVFGGASKTSDLEKALRQYDLYEMYLAELEPEDKYFSRFQQKYLKSFFKKMQ